jgi:serine/threonine protein kinase
LLKDDTPKLSDWGMGYTPAYAPPEVLLGESPDRKPDEKADIWSFGVVLYELIKGYNPFQGMDDIETMDRVLEFEPDFSNLGVYEKIIRRCLQKDKNKRFNSMDEIKKELAKIGVETYSRSFSMSKSSRNRVYSASEIISTYACEGDFKLAKDRLNSIKKYNLIPVKIADAMLAVIEIMEKCNGDITIDYLKSKYNFILELFDEHREEIEKAENIGILFKKIVLHQIISDDEKELIRNVFCRALLERIKLLAYRSIEID